VFLPFLVRLANVMSLHCDSICPVLQAQDASPAGSGSRISRKSEDTVVYEQVKTALDDLYGGFWVRPILLLPLSPCLKADSIRY